MNEDPIVAEVRRSREEIFRRCGNNFEKLGDYLQRRRKEKRLKVVRPRRNRAESSE